MRHRHEDAFLIREIAEKWSLYRDAGEFDRLAELFHPDGSIHTLWFQGINTAFIERARSIFSGGMASVHYLCGTDVNMAEDRAVASTNCKTYGRGAIGGQDYDLEATTQFCDLLERRDGRWAIGERWVVHVKDDMRSTDPERPLKLDRDLLASLPPLYRHLAYLHAKAGRAIKPNMPGLQGDSAGLLKARNDIWLAGRPLPPAF